MNLIYSEVVAVWKGFRIRRSHKLRVIYNGHMQGENQFWRTNSADRLSVAQEKQLIKSNFPQILQINLWTIFLFDRNKAKIKCQNLVTNWTSNHTFPV